MKYGTVPNTWLPGWEEVKPDQLLARGGRRVGRARFRVHGFKVNLSVPFKAMTDRLTTVRSPAEKLHLTDPVPMVWANHPLGAERPSDRPTGNSSVSVRLNGRRMSSRLEALRFPFYVVCDAHWNARFSSHLRTSFLNPCYTQNKLSLSYARVRSCVPSLFKCILSSLSLPLGRPPRPNSIRLNHFCLPRERGESHCGCLACISSPLSLSPRSVGHCEISPRRPFITQKEERETRAASASERQSFSLPPSSPQAAVCHFIHLQTTFLPVSSLRFARVAPGFPPSGKFPTAPALSDPFTTLIGVHPLVLSFSILLLAGDFSFCR